MMGYRTPVKARKVEVSVSASVEPEMAGSSNATFTTEPAMVRRLTGEWERATSQGTSSVSPKETSGALKEARKYQQKAKLHLSNSKNLKSEIKIEVVTAIDKLYEIVQKSEAEKTQLRKKLAESQSSKKDNNKSEDDILLELRRHGDLLQQNAEKIAQLEEAVVAGNTAMQATYAQIAATPAAPLAAVGVPAEGPTHSLLVASTGGEETGDEVISRIRHALRAKEGGVQIEKIRKVRDRKVVLALRTEKERREVCSRLRSGDTGLAVEDARVKDPLVVLKDVIKVHSDDDILSALLKQNEKLFEGLKEQADRMKIRYKKTARNSLTHHVVISLPPALWMRLTGRGHVYLDLQKIKVDDQSPLVQCSMCLAYGHSRKYCTEKAEICSHCGGDHLRAKCKNAAEGGRPTCCNCRAAGLRNHDHSAFSTECPVRVKWDALARASVAYC